MKHLARVAAFQGIYQLDMGKTDEETALTHVVEENELDEKEKMAAKAWVEGCQAHLTEIDAMIEEFSRKWKLARMCSVDRNILRLGAYELLFTELSTAIVINEAVELAKTYGTDESGKFVNGILDQIAKKKRG